VTEQGPGSPIDKRLVQEWSSFDMAGALKKCLGKPTRVANDADLQGAAVVKGDGLELVLTLGTGVGTGFFYAGRLLPHFEFSHADFRKSQTYNQQLGEEARKRIGNQRWNSRVRRAVISFRNLAFFDHCYVGGGNSKKVKVDLGSDVTIIDNSAGILGGIKLWEGRHLGL
jgi:polyphosphate glucokinase